MCSAGPQPSRRAVLGGALVGLAAPALAACTAQPREPAPPTAVPPDVVAADRAAERERRLLAAYDAALLIAPELTERLAPLRSDHAEHLAALGRPEPEATADATAAPDPDATPDPDAGSDAAADPEPDPDAEPGAEPPPPTVAAPVLPQDPAALLAALADLERRAGIAHGSAAVRGGRGVAVVLASLAAGEASHAAALT